MEILGCAGDGGCPIPIPSRAHPGFSVVPPHQEPRNDNSKGKELPPLCQHSPSSLGMNRGTVLVGDGVININYSKQPLQPTLVSTTFQDGERRGRVNLFTEQVTPCTNIPFKRELQLEEIKQG